MIKRVEIAAPTMVALIATAGLFDLLKLHFFSQATDSAMMVDLLAQAARGHGLVSSAFNAVYSIFPILGVDADTYCRSDFATLYRDVSGLRWHAYLMTFPLAALTWVPGLSALNVVVGAIAVNFIGSLLVVWLRLRRASVPIIVAAAFVVLLFVFKPWANAAMGQFYFDRLFLLPGLILVLIVHDRLAGRDVAFAWILALTILCALISERPAVMVGCFLIGYPVLVHGARIFRSRDSLLVIALGLCCWIYAVGYVMLFQDSPYKDVVSFAQMIANLKSALLPGSTYHPHTMKLFAVLIPLFAIAAFEWRLALVALGAVVPNLILAVGGAEKNNFFTHYHMAYLPFLFAASTMGLVRLWSLIARPGGAPVASHRLRRAIAAGGLAAAVAALAAYSDRINVGDLSRTFVLNAEGDRALSRAMLPILQNPPRDHLIRQGAFYRDLVAGIPDRSTVSSPEWLMPTLVSRDGMILDFAPIGAGRNRFMILGYLPAADGRLVLEVPSFSSPDQVARIRACIQSRVDTAYTVFKEATDSGVTYRIYALKE